jgi:acyl carrier protein
MLVPPSVLINLQKEHKTVNTTDTIRDFITHEILHGSLPKPLGEDDQLVESGIIDSLGVMTLLSFLEEKFMIQIPDNELTPENFASLSSITALVEGQRGR